MSTNPYERSALALASLELFPPSIRESLISDSDFRNRYGIISDGQISISDNAVSFRISDFYNTVREILDKRDTRPMLKDKSGKEWKFEVAEVNNECRIILSHGECRFFLPDFSFFSPDVTERLYGFERIVDDINLPFEVVNKWKEILVSRALKNDEFDAFQIDINETPIRVASLIRSGIEKGESDFTTLVPRSEYYFNCLVGMYQQSLNIIEYAHKEAKIHIDQLMAWRLYDGFLHALLLSSHSLLPSTIEIDKLQEDDLIRAYEWLQVKGDRISQLGAIEIGLSILDKHPKIEPYIKNLIQQILDDDPDDEHSRFVLLSALIVLVDGELARIRVLSEKPPFWRRLASIAQASVIEREVIDLPLNIINFSKWALQARAQIFYLQGISDLRCEPRWHPDSVSPHQLKAEFIGRIVGAANQNASKIEASTLYDLLLGESPDSIRSMIEFPFPFLPGPLEGGIESQNEPPSEVLQVIEERLGKDNLQPYSFAALVNSALLYRLDSHQAELAAKALRAVKYQIKQTGNKETLLPLLRGLANVAAVTRSVELADDLRILIRKCMHDPAGILSAEDAMGIGLIAAAAHSDLSDWCRFVGEFITELSFQSLQYNEIEKLYSHLQQLCHIVPGLWITCGRADAALNSAISAH